MSSFRRRTAMATIAGTRPSPYNASQPLLSTGLVSLDDLIGGGLPLSTAWLITGDDHASSYASLVLRFWLSQGVECAHDCLVVGPGDQVHAIIENLMDIDTRSDAPAAQDEGPDPNETPSSTTVATDQSGGDGQSEAQAQANVDDEDQDKMKIAFRYQGMKKHKTTVDEPSAKSSQDDVYCSLFDLTTKRNITHTERERIEVLDVDRLPIPESTPLPNDLCDLVFDAIEAKLTRGGFLFDEDVPSSRPSKALRIALSNFGGPAWGPSSPPTVSCCLPDSAQTRCSTEDSPDLCRFSLGSQSMYRFLARLRPLLRRSTASVCLTFPCYLHSPQTTTRLAHATDLHLALTSFSTSATSLAQFPRHQGLLAFPKLPTVGALVPSSMKLSVLRGIGGGGEGNDLGFRIKRRRFIVETVGADEPVSFGPATTTPVVAAVSPDAVEDKGATKFMTKSDKQVSVSRLIHEKPELYEF
ncbi:BZ3500_MvSof-1268-A1-R1_Chr7-1g09399 [Microbotryum saponariae]|uniref:Elongator complex protein 4 n=1 Tax=Microbotryum saponariae TaxID=289078 RepID=A0A2X0NE92_9BASI|nr:BZ3501_MvSof-1269-A2-R1_Chr7-1g09104 [Microbotryum saponariae]SDA03367.1 BZ3500_MvSof-1268-A1-R1_Chr7-1g09399 [Microbotryum saponariae]